MFVSFKKILLLPLILGAVSLTALDTNYNLSLNIADTLMVDHNTIRYVFNPISNQNTLTICGLHNGEEYHMSALNLCNSNTDPVIGHPNPVYTETTFKADGTCHQIELTESVCHPKPSALEISIRCQSCFEPPQTSTLASIITDDGYSPQELIEDVFISGDCFEVVPGSIEYTGSPDGLGFFSNGTDAIDIEEGIIISTGLIENSHGPNSAYNRSTALVFDHFETDLLDMLPIPTSVLDVALLEFDFVPTSDRVSFEFVFASEEYCEYAGSLFNDVFGFFISGPGINGPFQDNAENIAFIPNTTDYITINSVNHVVNNEYYVDNIPWWQLATLPPTLSCPNYPGGGGAAVEDIEFDGFTEVLTATAEVQPCETYHIKLAISDVSDRYFDSAVFLKANSFDAGGQAFVSSESPGTTDNVVLEGCTNGQFIFERTNEDDTDSLTINFSLSPMSTATLGEDFLPFPDSVIIPAGEQSVVLPIDIIEDFIAETNENIIIQLDAPCSCELPFSELTITDLTSLTVQGSDQVFCEPEMTILEPFVSGGQGAYSYEWNTMETSSTIQVQPDETTTYSVTVTDGCGQTAEIESTVTILESVSAFISGYEQVCAENIEASLRVEFTGAGPWVLEYGLSGQPPVEIQNIDQNPYEITVTETGTYFLYAVTDNGCAGEVSGVATVVPVEFNLTEDLANVSCPDLSDGEINITASGGTAPYSYAWDNTPSTTNIAQNLAVGSYTLTLTDADGCTIESTHVVGLDPGIPVVDAGINQLLNCFDPVLELEANGSAGSGYSLNWTTTEGNIQTGAQSLNPQINGAGQYVLTIENNITSCAISDTTDVSIDTISPVPIVNIVGPLELDCVNTSTTLDASSSQPQGQINFNWTTLNGEIEPGDQTSFLPQINSAGEYLLELTNTSNGCTSVESVSIITNAVLPQIDISPADPINCINAQVILNATQSDSSSVTEILWTTQNGNLISEVTSLRPLVDQVGTYYLSVYNTENNCENVDSIVVTSDLSLPVIDAGDPFELDCTNLSVFLEGTVQGISNYTTYWHASENIFIAEATSLNPEVDQPGLYMLEVVDQNNGCSSVDSVVVTQNEDMPEIILVDVTPPECFGENGMLQITEVEGGEGPFLFRLSEETQAFSGIQAYQLPAGTYELVTQDANGCELVQEVMIPAVQEVMVDVEPEVTIELGESYQLQAQTNLFINQIDSIHWTPADSLSCSDCLSPWAWPIFSTTYQVTVWDEKGCQATDRILLTVKKDRDVFIPNVFSPNNDGANDIFFINGNQSTIKEIQNFQIFSRWGEKVFHKTMFQPNDPDHGWDGRLKGREMIPGVFTYYAQIEFIDGETILYEGDVTLMK